MLHYINSMFDREKIKNADDLTAVTPDKPDNNINTV